MAASISRTAASSSGADQNAYTFSSLSFGAEASDRIIAVSIITRDAGTTPRSVTTVTIGGVSATVVVEASNIATNVGFVAIAYAAVPTGTTGDVVVDFDGSDNLLRCGVVVHRIVGSNPTPHDSSGADGANPSTTIDVPADGIALAVSTSGASLPTCTWTGLTEDLETQIGGEATDMSTASDAFGTTQTSLAVQATWSANVNPALAVASWGPSTAAITGDGAPAAQPATVDGAGVSGSEGAGALAAPAAVVDGAGVSGSEGDGALAAQPAEIADEGISGSAGVGAPAAQPADVEGAGVAGSAGAGEPAAQPSQIGGAGVSESAGAGAPASAAAAADGAGVSGSTGSGAPGAEPSVVAGTNVVVTVTAARRWRLRVVSPRPFSVAQAGSKYHLRLVSPRSYAVRQVNPDA